MNWHNATYSKDKYVTVNASERRVAIQRSAPDYTLDPPPEDQNWPNTPPPTDRRGHLEQPSRRIRHLDTNVAQYPLHRLASTYTSHPKPPLLTGASYRWVAGVEDVTPVGLERPPLQESRQILEPGACVSPPSGLRDRAGIDRKHRQLPPEAFQREPARRPLTNRGGGGPERDLTEGNLRRRHLVPPELPEERPERRIPLEKPEEKGGVEPLHPALDGRRFGPVEGGSCRREGFLHAPYSSSRPSRWSRSLRNSAVKLSPGRFSRSSAS